MFRFQFHPSGERWEYKEFISEVKETHLDFLNRLGSEGYQPETLEYSKVSKTYYGVFKRKLIIK